ncbi:MAG TPA: iron-siderophore ABC transporter substrate-binding protein [Mycobacterium sp.]
MGGLAAALVVFASTVTGCSSGPSDPPAQSLITSTTKIAGAGVLGNKRRPDESCATEPARTDPGPPMRAVRNAPGTDSENAEVHADPQRIVVLSGDQLDALCALGLQDRIVAAALPDGSSAQPSYLGTTVHDLPPAGTRSAPDLSAIAAAHPDLILGSQALTPTLYPALADIAPTVFTAAPGAAWEDNLRGVGAATGRTDTADDVINRFADFATETGAAHDATHFQASVVMLTKDTMQVYGAANFPATVLKAVGLDRPASQRFTDKPYLEVGTTNADLAGKADFSAADADVIYVSFASPEARERGATVLDSGPWRKLSANRDNRVFVVNNAIWQTGEGPIAAHGIVDDLQWVDAPIN